MLFTTLVATLAHTNSKKKKKEKHIQNPQEILEQLYVSQINSSSHL